MTAIDPLDQAQESAVPSLVFGSCEGRLWYLLQSRLFRHVVLDILHGLTYEILGIRPLLIDKLNN
jgi:hypothetical protein